MTSRAFGYVLLMSLALVAHAQQYRWIDQNGRVQYTDTPPPPEAKGVQKKNLSAGPARTVEHPYALQVALKKAPVKLYSTQECGQPCMEARKLLNGRGIPFNEILISEPAQIEELKKISGGTTVPVMVVGASTQQGFQEQSYHRTLDAAGYPPAGSLKPRNQGVPAQKVIAPPADAAKPAENASKPSK
jgi:glutaredoxin